MRKFLREAKNSWNKYSEIQILVREATSNDPWGASSHLMQKIAREADYPASYHEMMQILWKRLCDYPHIKHVIKSLALIDYLLLHASDRFVDDIRTRKETIRLLQGYKYIQDGRDIGQDVRSRAVSVYKLLNDTERLKRDRITARNVRGKIVGFSHHTSYQSSSPIRYSREENNSPVPMNRDQSSSDEDDESYVEQVRAKKKNSKRNGKKKNNVHKEKSPVSPSMKDEQSIGKDADFNLFDGVEENVLFNSEPVSSVVNTDFYGTEECVEFDPIVPSEKILVEEQALFDDICPLEGDLDGSGSMADSTELVCEYVDEEESSDVWDLGKDMLCLTDINVTSEEKRIQKNIMDRKNRLNNGPKLNEIKCKSSTKNPFLAELGYNQTAHQQYYDSYSGAAGNHLALVPVQSSYYPTHNYYYHHQHPFENNNYDNNSSGPYNHDNNGELRWE